MTSAPLLDTHIWVWWMHGDSRLNPEIVRELDALPESRRPIISDISLWEVATLVSLGRLRLDKTLDSWFSVAASRKTVKVWPITPSIASEVSRLPDSFHRDPADRLIVATSRTLGAPLITLDDRIMKSGLAPLWPTSSRPRSISFRDRLPRLFDLKDSVNDAENPRSYFRDFEASLKLPTGKLEALTQVEAQLAKLDVNAWQDLRMRAASCAVAADPRGDGRGWQEMFDVLSEARAYGYLLAIGGSDIEFIPRSDRKKRPDLKARTDDGSVLCEVKTINISDLQAARNARRAKGEITVQDAQTTVGEGLLNKIASVISDGLNQLRAHDPKNESRWVIFIGLNFDDFLNEYIDRYIVQIDDYLARNPVTGVSLVFAPRSNPFERVLSMRNGALYLD